MDELVQRCQCNDHSWYRYQYCMPGATNYVLSDGNDMNDNNTSTPSSSLSAAAAATYLWVRHKYST